MNGSGGSNGKCCVTRKRSKNIRRVRELSGMIGWRDWGKQQNEVEELGGSDE